MPVSQVTSVPVCSRAPEPCEAPPMPIQKAASPDPESQLAVGWVQDPETLENCAPEAA